MQDKFVKILAASVAVSAMASPVMAGSPGDYTPPTQEKIESRVNAYATPVTAPAKEKRGWSGFYIGAQGGQQYGSADLDFNTEQFVEGLGGLVGIPIERGNATLDLDGFVGGAHVGFHVHMGPYLFGLEADIETGISNSVDMDVQSTLGDPGFSALNIDVDQKYQSSIRGKLGWANDRAMIYATAGVAFSSFDYDVVGTRVGLDPEFDSFTNDASGYTVGAGVGFKITDNVSLGTEYRFTDYGAFNKEVFRARNDALLEANPNLAEDVQSELEADLQFHTISARLSYHF